MSTIESGVDLAPASSTHLIVRYPSQDSPSRLNLSSHSSGHTSVLKTFSFMQGPKEGLLEVLHRRMASEERTRGAWTGREQRLTIFPGRVCFSARTCGCSTTQGLTREYRVFHCDMAYAITSFQDDAAASKDEVLTVSL